jgi:hypothetical protein
VSIYYPKDSYLVAPFDELLIWFQSSGLMAYWASQEMDYKYLSYNSEAAGPKVMSLEHLSGTFQIWIFLCIFAILVFMLEIIWNAGNMKIGSRSSRVRTFEMNERSNEFFRI